MISGFKKAIENFILPQFPWLTGFKVETPWIDDDGIRVLVSYYVELDDNGYFEVTPEFEKVEELTKSVFKMMNDGNHGLNNIRFTHE